MKSSKADARMRIVPIFIIIAVLLAISISSESEKQIDISFEFSNLTNYDLDNDGVELTRGIVDLYVGNSEFNWEADKEKLLTRWTIINENKEAITSICYGNNEGCSFIGLDSLSESWDDVLYVNFGKDGAGYDNKIISQVIYYDVDLNVPYSEIYYSKESSKEVKFYEENLEEISNLKIVVKNKEGENIGDHRISINDIDYDLTISNKKISRKDFSITGAIVSMVSKPESKVEIEKIRNVEDIEAVIDETDDEEITTDIIAINASDLEFGNAEVVLAKHGEVNSIMRCEEFDFENSECDNWEQTNIQFKDEGDVIKFNVTGFSAYGGSEITILNVHSYPPLYGNWTVYFNTLGTADLKIRAVNGTTWTNIYDVGSGYDLKFLGIKCGDVSLDYEWVNNEVIVRDYYCDETGSETQKELTTGEHYLEFEFGDDIAYAENTVGVISGSATVEKGETATYTSSGSCSSWEVYNGSEFCDIASSSGCTAYILGKVEGGACFLRVRNSSGLNGNQNKSIRCVDTTSPTNDMTINASDWPRDQWENGIQVVWSASSSTDATNYTIYRNENLPSGGVFIYNDSKGGNYSDQNVGYDTNRVFYYGVIACDYSTDGPNCNEGVWSDAVSINAMPTQNISIIRHIDDSVAAGSYNGTTLYYTHKGNGYNLSESDRVAVTTDNLKCIGIGYDRDNESLSMKYNITILETYSSGSTVHYNGITTDCIYFDSNVVNWQNKYNLSKGHTYCIVNINSSLTSRGDKIDCVMTPYDTKEYGDSRSSNDVFINNTKPFASNAYITPSTPNESSTLTCNYTFNDIDYDSENTTEPLFKWYINNEGLNDFIEVNGQTRKTLSSLFDKDDIVMCAVKVKDVDIGWLKNPLFDDIYVNSTSKVIVDNAKPQITAFSDDSNSTIPTTMGSNALFSVTWADYEDENELAQMFVCDSKTSSEGGENENGTGYIRFGRNNTVILYTNLTGEYVDTIAINASTFENSTGNYTLNGSSNYFLDVYAFEVTNVGDIINNSAEPIAEDHDNAFRVNQYTYIKLQYNAEPQENKRLAIMFCADSNDGNSIYCKSDIISSGSDGIYVNATDVSPANMGNDTRINTSDNTQFQDANIEINYASTSGGDTSNVGCVGTEYCSTSLSATSDISCSYTTLSTDPQKANTYYVKVCDDGEACSVWRQGDFWVNKKPEMNWVNLTAINGTTSLVLNFTTDKNLNCTHKNKSDAWVKWNDTHTVTLDGNLTYTYKWYVNRTGTFVLYDTSPTAQILSHANTQDNDQWKCEVTPNDGFTDGIFMTSSIRSIGAQGGTGQAANGTPYITNIIDNSNQTYPTNQGSLVTFDVYWTDSNSTGLKAIYVCNSTSVDVSGCLDTPEYGRSGATSSNPASVSFIASGNWSENQTAHVYIYDDTWIKSGNRSEDFAINHRPSVTAAGVSISYTSANSLTCDYTFSDVNDTDDGENTTLREFKWWLNGEQSVYDNKTVGSIAIPGNTWKCGVKVYDNHSLSSTDYINSSNFTGTDTIIKPIIWEVPEATREPMLQIYGYINKTLNTTGGSLIFNVTAVTRQNYFVKVNATVDLGANSSYIGKGYAEDNFAINNSFVVIDEDYHTYFIANTRFIEFANHNRSINKAYFRRYNITAKTYLFDGTYRIDISPDLEKAVANDEEIYVYNDTKPTGWFNLSLNLFNRTNDITVRGYENPSGNVWLTGLPKTFTIYYDNETPFVNTTKIIRSSSERVHTINFSMTDDFKLNLSTLLINITNGTYNISHRYDGLVWRNDSKTWGNNITCTGNNTHRDCNVSLDLKNGNYSMNFTINDSVNRQYNATIKGYVVDSTRLSAPTVNVRSIQNITNLSALWTDSSENITEAQYAVGTARYPDTGWNSLLAWTNATEDPRNKTSDADNDNYPDSEEAVIDSIDYLLNSTDSVVKAGNASFTRFTNGTEMFNCENASAIYFYNNCTIVKDNNSDSIYDNATDNILLNGSGYSIANGSALKNFTSYTVYADNNHNGSYERGEAIINDTNENMNLSVGLLNGGGNDTVLVNGSADMLIPLTTTTLSLVNHNFYYISMRYKNDQNLFYSNVGSSLSIKYKTSSGGGGNTSEDNYTGPSAVIINASLVAETKTLSANWTESTDERYPIDRYEYAIGSAKHPSSDYNSITVWRNASTNLTASYTSNNLEDGVVYYWNVKAINSIDNESVVNSSIGTTYYDQISPDVNLTAVANDTNSSYGWVDDKNDNITWINVTADETMTCFISPYDKGYLDFNSANDTRCAANASINVTCNLSNFDQGNYTYHVVCQDNTDVPNKDTSLNNLDIDFSLEWPDVPEVGNFTMWIHYANMTLKGNASNQSNTTFSNDILVCNGTFYDKDGDSLASEDWEWRVNNTKINGQTSSQLDLSVNGSKGSNITCIYNVTDSAGNYSSYNYSVVINNSKMSFATSPVVNSTRLGNKSNESLTCYVPTSYTDADNDTIINYTYLWFKNNSLDTIGDTTNITNHTLYYKNTSKGNIWVCSVIPYDGEENGTASANSTNLTILNSRPILNGTMPNRTWNTGNYSSAYELGNYFFDEDGDSLNYSSTGNSTITININSNGGVNLSSVTVVAESVNFTATDETYTVTSNTVILNVTNSTINVSLNSPVNRYNSSNVSVSFNCSANTTASNNLTNVTLYIWNSSGNLIGTNTTNFVQGNKSTNNFSINFSYNDDFTWDCHVNDSGGNVGQASSTYSLTIDTTYPLIAFTTGTPVNHTNASRNWTYANVDVTEANERNITFYIKNTTAVVNSTTYTTSQRTLNWTTNMTIEDNYTYNVTVCDIAGNCNETENRLIVIDTSAPSMVGNLVNTSINNSGVILNWTPAKDNRTGVMLYKIYRNGTYLANTTNKNYTDSGLNGATNYLYNVSSYDYAGNENRTASLAVKTSTDVTPPVIRDVVNTSISSSSEKISWKTDDNSNSSVSYGTTITLGTNSSNTALTTTHNVTLTGLSSGSSGVLYYYNITSCNSNSNCSTNGTFNFTTAATTPITPSSGGGGGGGGGSTTKKTTGIEVGSSYGLYYLGKNDKLNFVFKDETYTLEVIEVRNDYITVVITPNTQTFSISVGDTTKVDLDKDVKKDIELKLSRVEDNKAHLLIRLYTRSPLRIIQLPPSTEPEPESYAPKTIKEKIEEYVGPEGTNNTLVYAITAFMALALVGGLVMKEKVRIDYMSKQPELNLHKFIKRAKRKGHDLDEIRKTLVKKGWPIHTVEAISLHDTIAKLRSKGHNHDSIRKKLKNGGFSRKIINDAMMHHHIHKQLRKRKSVKKIREGLIKAGWNKKEVNEKLPAK